MVVPALAQSKRPEKELVDKWKFIRQEATPDVDTSNWETVIVPHTWNALDGQNGKAADPQYRAGYYRGPAWYARQLEIPSSWKGKRIFLRFEAASLVAETYVNGQRMGEHRGGFTAFCYDITPYLQFDGKDILRVRVDNTRFEDVAPLAGDFNVFGGIYRPIHLFATDPVCITPLDSASSGVYLKVQSLSPGAAAIEAETRLSNATKKQAQVQVETQIKDASGKVVATRTNRVTLAPLTTTPVVQQLAVQRPHLWQGRKDPYLYSATIRVRRSNQWVDQVVQPLGMRTVAISQDRGFLLNGQPYPIRGVNRHQDWPDKGWAISQADQENDLRLMLEMGVNAVRLSHYPQSEYFHSLCERNGVLLWEEIPQVNEMRSTSEFNTNAETQLREMVLQHYNSPSVAFWGLSNELDKKWANAGMLELQKQKGLAHRLDSTRPVVSAVVEWGEKEAAVQVPDWIGYNAYPGWYWGNGSDMGSVIDRVYQAAGKRIAMSEYGAGGNPFQHQEGELKAVKPGSQFHPEEYQTYMHQLAWEQMQNNPRLWGTFLWVMFDFSADWRNEGGVPGQNDKGMVTRDRKIKKDAFYFYQANWTETPMIHITSQRMTPRLQPETQIKVFSNCSQVEVKVNGRSLGVASPDSVHVFRWKNVQLQPGKNRIEAIGRIGGQELRDECTWTLQTPLEKAENPQARVLTGNAN